MKNLLFCAVIIMSLAVIGCGGDDPAVNTSTDNEGGIYAPHIQALNQTKELKAKATLQAIHTAQGLFSASNGKGATSFKELAESGHLQIDAFKTPDGDNKVKVDGYVFEQEGEWDSSVYDVNCYPEDGKGKKFKMDSNGKISEYK